MKESDELRELRRRAYGRHADAPAPSSSRRWSWRRVVIAAVCVLAIFGGGYAVGALVDGPTASAVELTAEQRRSQDTATAGRDFDAASGTVLGVVNEVVIWTATKGGGEWTCLLLGQGERNVTSCNPTPSARVDGLYAVLTVDDGSGTSSPVAAELAFAADGRPTVVTTAGPAVTAAAAGHEADEATIAANLARLGLDATSLRIVGRDGGVPIWVGESVESGEICLVPAGDGDDPVMSCDRLGEGPQGGVSAARQDAVTGTSSSYTYVRFGGGESLAVTRDGPGARVG